MNGFAVGMTVKESLPYANVTYAPRRVIKENVARKSRPLKTSKNPSVSSLKIEFGPTKLLSFELGNHETNLQKDADTFSDNLLYSQLYSDDWITENIQNADRTLRTTKTLNDGVTTLLQ